MQIIYDILAMTVNTKFDGFFIWALLIDMYGFFLYIYIF